MLAFIQWAPDPTVFTIGNYSIRWYALCWCCALLLAYWNMHRLYRDQRIPEEKFEPLFFYCFVFLLLGARLGHCLFYEPVFYLTHPVQMLLPIRQMADGSWKMVGYEGLSSHGGVLGLFVAIWLYCRKTKVNVMRVLDNMGVATPLSAAFIRLGNLFNSEIVGYPTDMPWGFVFLNNGETFARHPAQLYESLFYLSFFFVMLAVYRYHKRRTGSGFFFGLCLTVIFTFRILIELIKEDQVDFEAGQWLNMGQILSIPLVVIGLYCLLGGKWCRRIGEKPQA